MDEKKLNDKIAIAAAFASLDFGKFDSETGVERAVLKRLSLAEDLLADDSIAMRMMDSIRIVATIKDVRFEESSQRYVVSFVADRGDGKVETIRTDRTDDWRTGALVKRMWGSNLVGQKVVIFKHNEVPTKEQAEKARANGVTVPPQGYRNAVYVTRYSDRR